MKGRTALLLLIALALTGCASTVPEPIRETAPGDVQVSEVQAEPDQFRGAEVRWGGTILATDNREDETWITVLARPLESDGRPRAGAAPLGRFIAVLPGFEEPAVFERDRELTVRGILRETVTRKVGEYPYHYPVVRAGAQYLWPRPEPRRYYYDPWYDPWYGPYPYRSPFYDPYWMSPYWW